MNKNYKEITTYEGMIINGIKGLFTCERISLYHLPNHINKYSIRHSDEGNDWFCSIEKNVLTNHCGDFITKSFISFDTNCFWKNIDEYEYLSEEETETLKAELLSERNISQTL